MVPVDEAKIRAMERAAAGSERELYTLMCRAGEAAAEWINTRRERFRRVIVLAGGGNNGGDALVAARKIELPVLLYTAKSRTEYTGVAAFAAADLPENIGLHPLEELDQVRFMRGDLVVDGLLGTGYHSAVMRESCRKAIRIVNAARIPVLALDLPSGLDCNTGMAVSGCAVAASTTLCFGAWKRGLLLGESGAFTGHLELAEIGLPQPEQGNAPDFQTLTWEEARLFLPRRSWDSHKKSHGSVAVLAGSLAYPGAAALAATGALRGGAGLVRLCAPVRPENLPNAVIFVPAPAAENGTLAADNNGVWPELFAGSDVLAAGPGWGCVPEELLDLICRFPGACVLDADALNLIARCPERWHAPARCVLTPHPGEAARLGKSFGVAPCPDRLQFARRLAAALHAVVLLKGPRSVIASPGGGAWINPTGDPALATAGSGDVLTGVIAALLGRGLPAPDAAVLGAFLHGLAGERGGAGLIADDLPELIAALECDLSANSL